MQNDTSETNFSDLEPLRFPITEKLRLPSLPQISSTSFALLLKNFVNPNDG